MSSKEMMNIAQSLYEGNYDKNGLAFCFNFGCDEALDIAAKMVVYDLILNHRSDRIERLMTDVCNLSSFKYDFKIFLVKFIDDLVNGKVRITHYGTVSQQYIIFWVIKKIPSLTRRYEYLANKSSVEWKIAENEAELEEVAEEFQS